MTPVVNSWWGNLPFSLEDPVSRQALAIGQKYVDPYTRAYDAGSAAAAAFLCAHGAGFTTAIAALRDLARPVQNVLLDELEFRWANPDAPEGLYVITHEVEPRGSGCSLIADHKRVGTRAWSTKVGKAKRSLVGRLAGYRNAYRHALIPDATLSVRVVIYGAGVRMPVEPDIQRVARSNAVRLYTECTDGVTRAVSRESYFGLEVLIPLTAFASEVVGKVDGGNSAPDPTRGS